MLRILCLIMLVLAAAPARASDAETMADQMLKAVGGREAWAAATGTINDSQQSRAEEPAQIRAIISMDFTKPRFRIENRGEGFFSERVIDGERSWRRTRDGVLGDVPAELFAEDMRWYGAHLYRSIHRLAKRDPALRLAVGEDGRLLVFEGEVRMMWFRLDPRGEPYAFGAWDDESGTILGPWEFEAGGLKHPIWTARPDGTWRAHIKALTVNPDLPDALFARPEK